MTTRRPLTRDQLLVAATLLFLGVLGLLLLIIDQSHRPPGESRAGWSQAAPAKP